MLKNLTFYCFVIITNCVPVYNIYNFKVLDVILSTSAAVDCICLFNVYNEFKISILYYVV